MTVIQQNLQQIHRQIAAVATQCGRSPQQITLLAVSKTKPVSLIEEAIAAGQYAFGENYVQEGVEKILQLQPRYPGLQWHFIGPLQANKSKLVAGHFDWCHTLDRLRIAARLNDQRPACLAPLNVLIQVNISEENRKSGISEGDLPVLAAEIAALPRLKLRGLMAIPAPENDYQQQLAVCQRMANAFARLQANYPQADTLSLGMSDDLAAAITAGSTMVRIGRAIFGARHNRAP
ncbi:YggS family pyridoxal phosphate-dependent enzyme [Enterobacteriaceae bacterium LUAb1]